MEATLYVLQKAANILENIILKTENNFERSWEKLSKNNFECLFDAIDFEFGGPITCERYTQILNAFEVFCTSPDYKNIVKAMIPYSHLNHGARQSTLVY